MSLTTRSSVVATLAEARLLELVPAVTHRLLRTPATAVFGYDFFVSYARKDASRYAERLYQELESRGYVTCFDRSDLNAGERLSDALARACERSQCTVLVDTVGARESQYVADEIGRVERKGAKGRLIRVMAPKVLPLGFSSPPDPARTWAHLPPAAQDLLANAIGVDDAVGATGVAEGAVSDGVVDEIVKHRRRVRTLRRFTAVALGIVAALAYGIGTLAWQRSIASNARGLAASALSVNVELAALYARARSLGNHAVAAGALPLGLPPEAEAEVQNALRAVLRVTAAAQGSPLPLAMASTLRRVVLTNDGGLAWRARNGRVLAWRGPATAPREIVPEGTAFAKGADVLDWTATLDGPSPRAIVVRGDRFETWHATGSDAQPVTCQPSGLTWQRATAFGQLALVAGPDSVGVVDAFTCAVLWQRRLDTLGAQSVAALRMTAPAEGSPVAAIDSGQELHVLDAASGRPIQRATYKASNRLWSVSATGSLLAAAIGGPYFALTAGPSSSLDEALTYSHPRGPILDIAFSPDGVFIASATTVDIRIWKTAAANMPTGPSAVRELLMPWPPGGVAFAGPRAAFYAMPPLSARVGAELQPLQVPDGLEFTSVPVPMDNIVAVHARGTTVAIEGPGSVQLVAVAPAAFWADRVKGGDLPDQVEERDIASASLLSGGDIEVRLLGETSDGAAWRMSSRDKTPAWRQSPPASSAAATAADLPRADDAGCRARAGTRYAVTICPDGVRLYRRAGARGAWRPQADLSCTTAGTGCRPPEHPVPIRDVAIDEEQDRLIALHVAGRRYFTVTYPLSTRGLRNAVASIDDALPR